MRRRLVAVALLGLAAAAPATSLSSSVLGHLVGDWIVQGPVMGHATCSRAAGRLVLGGQFIELQVNSLMPRRPYQVDVFIGLDGTAVSIHWLDVFGPEAARTLGVGALVDDGARVDFAYPTGAFHDLLTYDGAADRWRLLVQDTGADGKPEVFSDWRFSRATAAKCAPL